jgi:hypothetical protein
MLWYGIAGYEVVKEDAVDDKMPFHKVFLLI